MKAKLLQTILMTVFVISSSNVIGQDRKNNMLMLNYGTVIWEDQISINFERSILQTSNRIFETRIKANYGKYLSNNFDYDIDAELIRSYYAVSAVQLIYLGSLGLEANLGSANIKFLRPIDSSPSRKWKAYGGVAARYTQKGFTIRAGLNNIELLSLGIGYNF